MEYSFERLDAWKISRELNKDVFKATSKFPKNQEFSLVRQIQKSSISISSNLAEGCSRKSIKDQSRFFQIAYGSAMELISQLILSKDLEFINEVDYKELRKKVESITFKIYKLTENLEKKIR